MRHPVIAYVSYILSRLPGTKMKKVPIEVITSGETLAADVFDPDISGEFPLLSRGITLTTEYIESLKKRGITDVLILTPPGYRGKPGETLVPNTIDGDIFFDGMMELDIDIPPQTKIEAGETITINGNIAAGCFITSANGAIRIKGSVQGAKEQRVKINAAQNITIETETKKPVVNADLKTVGEIHVAGSLNQSTASAKGRIIVNGKISGSQLYTQTRMSLQECGDECTHPPSILLVKPHECRQLIQQLLKKDEEIRALLTENEKLQNIIDLIKKLGKSIDDLPQDKRAGLAAGVKRFHDAKIDIANAQKAKQELKNAMEAFLGAKRIIIKGTAFPNTKITIENSSLLLQEKMQSIAFFVQNYKVVSSAL